MTFPLIYFTLCLKMWNNSKSLIQFQWDRLSDCHIMEVEPPMGEIGTDVLQLTIIYW